MVMKRIKDGISTMDVFGSEIKLNLLGRERFQTVKGGLLTIVIKALILW